MDPAYEQAMEALGRPDRPEPASAAATRRRLRDAPILLLALVVGGVVGVLAGEGLIPFAAAVALPLALTLAVALVAARSIAYAFLAGILGSMLGAGVGVTVGIMRALGSLWS